MNTKQRVFVTGASSELMLQVLSKIDAEKFDITGLSRSRSPQKHSKIDWVEGDIQNPEQYRNSVAASDIIIHGAAITHSRKQKEYFDVNYEGTRKLISCISKEKKPLFVLISSRVAGKDSGAYGVSKLMAEDEVKKTDSWLIIRPAEVYGGTKSEGIEKTIRTALKGGVQLCPVGVESKMYPIHLTDTANAIYQSVFEDPQTEKVKTVNGKIGYSFKEILELTQKLSRKGITIVPIPKWFLTLVGFASRLLPMDIGFVPDQVDRLYSKKTHENATNTTIELEAYIEQLVQQENA